jgi:hypothetical protein
MRSSLCNFGREYKVDNENIFQGAKGPFQKKRPDSSVTA